VRFLVTLLWMLLAVVVALFAARNWQDVTVALWGAIELDIKLPLLMLLLVLAGVIPTWLTMRARHWRAARNMPRQVPPPVAPSPAAAEEDA
jgi:putative membrane protein